VFHHLGPANAKCASATAYRARMPKLLYRDIEPVLRAHIEHVLALAALMAEAARLRREGAGGCAPGAGDREGH
jgi:hypothetical protein